MSSSGEYEFRLRPNRNWVRVDWRGLWEYRDLLFLLVRRDFVSRYRQTILGPAWFVLQPVLTTLVFTIIFGSLAKLPTDGLPPLLFYLGGMLGWSYFANNFNSTAATLQQNAALFGKVYFPRLIVPLSSVISNLFALGLQFATFLAFWCYFEFCTPVGSHLRMSWTALAAPAVVVHPAVLSLGVGLWLSALTAKYRDFTHLLTFLIQMWMYATPVIYPLSMIPAKWRWAVELNPASLPIEALRQMFLGTGQVTAGNYLFSASLSGLTFLSGLLLFQKVERTFVDTV